MKRIYIAIIFIALSILIGAVEFYSINSATDEVLTSLNKTESLISKDKFDAAEDNAKNTAEKYEKHSKSILYCYYKHDILEEITEQLFGLEDLLDDRMIEDYHEQSHMLKKKLLSIKEKEQLTIQNLL